MNRIIKRINEVNEWYDWIVVEKPTENDLAQCAILDAAANQSGVAAVVGIGTRYPSDVNPADTVMYFLREAYLVGGTI